eukprot:COSAG05_NODE_1678_length_4291_cov_649.414122_5_plen_230_part_00
MRHSTKLRRVLGFTRSLALSGLGQCRCDPHDASLPGRGSTRQGAPLCPTLATAQAILIHPWALHNVFSHPHSACVRLALRLWRWRWWLWSSGRASPQEGRWSARDGRGGIIEGASQGGIARAHQSATAAYGAAGMQAAAGGGYDAAAYGGLQQSHVLLQQMQRQQAVLQQQLQQQLSATTAAGGSGGGYAQHQQGLGGWAGYASQQQQQQQQHYHQQQQHGYGQQYYGR